MLDDAHSLMFRFYSLVSQFPTNIHLYAPHLLPKGNKKTFEPQRTRLAHFSLTVLGNAFIGCDIEVTDVAMIRMTGDLLVLG